MLQKAWVNPGPQRELHEYGALPRFSLKLSPATSQAQKLTSRRGQELVHWGASSGIRLGVLVCQGKPRTARKGVGRDLLVCLGGERP